MSILSNEVGLRCKPYTMKHRKVSFGCFISIRSVYQVVSKTLMERVPQKRDERELGQVKAGVNGCRQDHS